MAARAFYTGLLVPEEHPPRGRVHAKNWRVAVKPSNPVYAEGGEYPELVVEASSLAVAQKALDLIVAMHQIVVGPEVCGRMTVRPEDSVKSLRDLNHNEPATVCCFEFPVACRMAARASFRRDFVYAAALYAQSQALHSNHPMDLEPRLYPYPERSELPRDHVRFAYAIVTAYAVVEQLRLGIQASREKPSRIGGDWNPVVKDELIKRLRKAGVDPDQPQLWLIRGAKTGIELQRPCRRQATVSWSRGVIRDCDVALIDAIADVSWLRSRIAAHRTSDLVRLLSVHDVANAQLLAQRLLLDSLGCAKVPTKRRGRRRALA